MSAASMRESFRQQGFYHEPGFLTPEEIARIPADLDWLVQTQLHYAGIDAPADEPPTAGTLSRHLIELYRSKPEAQAWIYDEVNRRPWMMSLAADERLISRAQALLSPHVAIHTRLNLVMSMPFDQWHIGVWHQDAYYGPANHLVAYIPLQPTHAENGGLKIAPGMHARGLLPHRAHREWGIESKFHSLAPDEVASFPELRQLELGVGDLLLFDRFLPHSAGVNRSPEVRFALTIRYSDLEDPFFAARGWVWKDLAQDGLAALAGTPARSEARKSA